MTGLQPTRHGIRHLFRERLDLSCETIASVLSAGGYASSAVVSCPGLNAWYEIGRGFALYDDEIPRLPDGTDPLETIDVKLRGRALKRADLVVTRSQAQLERLEAGKPFCHFLHFFDAHWPYEPPDRPFAYEVANAYEAEVGYLDYFFSRWLDWMEATGRLEETLVVLFADHGEDLEHWYPNDRGGEHNGHPEEMGHGCLLYDQTIMVPLIIAGPGVEAREVREQVRLIDVFPTVMEMLDVRGAPKVDGASLAPALRGQPIESRIGYSETLYPREQVDATGNFEWTRNKKSVRVDNRWKHIYHLGSDEVEMYDLVADPLERENLVPADPVVVSGNVLSGR